MNHDSSFLEVAAERAFLRKLGGGCHVPIAARAVVDGELINLIGLIADTDGRRVCRGSISGPTAEAVALGTALAERLLRDGAGEMLGGLTTGI